jgi:DNA-binding beta-propeller fold protein YncE
LETSPPAPIPPGSRVDATSGRLAYDAARHGIWTANGDVGSVTFVDVNAQAALREVPIGGDVTSVALSPDGRWVAAVDAAGGAVALVDAEQRARVVTIPVGSRPRAAVWDAADPRWLYVALEGDASVAVVDRTLGVLTTTAFVGRSPSGLAVSKTRSELYVAHRIDAQVTVVPLPLDPNGTTAAFALAAEAGDGKGATPHGAPFAFESFAWGPDGATAWMPHELLAPTHPFAWGATLFPAVSVVDLANRAEVVTDPNDPAGVVAGRKNLFAAIDLHDASGTPIVVSQPCAAAFHPNGKVAYALACASEDLVVFDAARGIATGILRGLPGDHPVGLAIATDGSRAYVLDDQSEDAALPAPALHSKSLHVLDLGAAGPSDVPRVIGDAIPIVANDPAPSTLRAGLRFFYRANSAKGALATTANDWMACGGCHLDGFGSSTAVFFDTLAPADATQDARIGHTGLRDLFSSAPRPNPKADPPFVPHDALVAFLEQGGLAPDRTGGSQAGAIDPDHPTADAQAMADGIAAVVARDLPLGPTRLMPSGGAPNLTYDGSWCGQCHATEYQAWQKSAHAHAAVDPMVRFGATVETSTVGAQFSRLCAGCHDPVSARAGDTTLASGRGITCLGCHDTERLLQAGGNADLVATTYDWTQTHATRASAALATLRDPRFCGACHQQYVPGTGLAAIGTLREYESSPFSGAFGGPTTSCVDCHAPLGAGNVADHAMVGGNVYLASQVTGDDAMAALEQANLHQAIGLTAQSMGGSVTVTVRNRSAGHSFPTGVTDIREPWVELQAVDAQGNVVARYGGPQSDGTLPPEAARLGMDIATGDGTLLVQHELSAAVRVPFLKVVPALGIVSFTLSAPPLLPAPATQLDAVLLYRNVRLAYFRAASGGQADVVPPEVEVARIPVP